MTQAMTLMGPVDVDQLGPTLMHEHLFVMDPEVASIVRAGWDEERAITEAVDILGEIHTQGVRTIVDLTVLGLGRDVARVRKVAKQVDVNVVVATGLYTFSDLPSYFRNRGPGALIDGPETVDRTLHRRDFGGYRRHWHSSRGPQMRYR